MTHRLNILIPLMLVDLLKNKIMMPRSMSLQVKLLVFIALATTVTVLNAVKNEIPNVSDLVKKTDLDKKYQILSLNMLPHLIIINLQIIYLMQR